MDLDMNATFTFERRGGLAALLLARSFKAKCTSRRACRSLKARDGLDQMEGVLGNSMLAATFPIVFAARWCSESVIPFTFLSCICFHLLRDSECTSIIFPLRAFRPALRHWEDDLTSSSVPFAANASTAAPPAHFAHHTLLGPARPTKHPGAAPHPSPL